MSARAFTNPSVGHQVQIEQYGKEVRLIFHTSSQAKSDALVENLLTQLKAGELNLTLMGKPTSIRGGPMHRVPALQWQTWVRLAFVEAGSDWRSLNRLRVQDGLLQDFGIEPITAWQPSVLGVQRWTDTSGTIAGRSSPTNGAYSVADPRRQDGLAEFGQYGVKRWDETSQTVIGKAAVGAGNFAVADPRHGGAPKFNNIYRIVDWNRPGGTVTSNRDAGVADPRPINKRQFDNIYRVTDWSATSRTVIGATAPADGAMSVADPRPAALSRSERDVYLTAGHYGVVRWDEPTGAIPAHPKNNNGPWSVADPRRPALPAASDRLVAVIQSTDDTWHRPFTTLELASLQSLVDPEEMLELDGLSDGAWRERIGNAVPPDAAQAIAETMGRTLLLAWAGAGFMLSSVPIWVRPVAVALSVEKGSADA